MNKLQELAEYLGFNTHIINDEVYVKTDTGYELFRPLSTHASVIEEKFQLSTIYGAVNGWSSQSDNGMHNYASTANKARLLAALSNI